MLQIRPEDIDQYYKTTVSDPMMQQFTEEIMPAIKGTGAPRLWGTDYQTQEQYAARDLERGLIQGRGAATSEYLNRALSAAGLAPSISEAESRGVQTQQAGSQTLADILSKGVSDYTGIIGTKSTVEAQRMAAEAQKAGLTPTAISTMMSALSQGAQLGAVPRQIEEAGLTAQYQEWMRQQQEEKTRVNRILSALGLQPMDTYAFARVRSQDLFRVLLGLREDQRLLENGC